jgi:hypothetical protein
MPDKVDPAPINALLEKISDLDQDKIALIARTLGQTEVFNDVVREQTSKMEIGERFRPSPTASTPYATTPSAWWIRLPTARWTSSSAAPTCG